MKIKTYKVFSLCKDFDSDIYPEMYEESFVTSCEQSKDAILKLIFEILKKNS